MWVFNSFVCHYTLKKNLCIISISIPLHFLENAAISKLLATWHWDGLSLNGCINCFEFWSMKPSYWNVSLFLDKLFEIRNILWFVVMWQLNKAYDTLTSKRPCGPNRSAIRGATYDLAKNDPWKEPFDNLPEYAFEGIADWERNLIQDRVRSLRGSWAPR
jgi:hypothetical protein